MSSTKKAFIREITKELVEENVAIFAGAGMSAASGFVNWAELLEPIAEELELDINKEHNLVALAQYHCNSNGSNRSQLNKRLIEEFSSTASETENHKILCRLPINTYWTTNYDKLIETSLSNSGKIADVKYTKQQLAHTKPRRDAIVYKMHGDIDHPNDAVLTRDDYESYHVKMDDYLSTLKGNLISKTFIFIGFSFSDPNLDYILSRVRVAYKASQRRHYSFIRKVNINDCKDKADFEYKLKKQQLFIDDLHRYNIKTILIDEYTEITELLSAVEAKYKQNTVFISGAAHDYGTWGEKESLKFTHNLSQKMIKNGHKIVSGFGIGVGSAVISGALESIYFQPNNSLKDQLILRPFPQTKIGKQNLATTWSTYRRDMISHAGVALFIFGNKEKEGKIIMSNGMIEEYEIAKKQGLEIIPIGSTGYASMEIWEREMKDTPSKSSKAEFLKYLCDSTKTPAEITAEVLKFLKSK